MKHNPQILAAGKMGGEYLESIKKYDLSTLSLDEWHTFLEVVLRNYENKVNNLLTEEEIPLW